MKSFFRIAAAAAFTVALTGCAATQSVQDYSTDALTTTKVKTNLLSGAGASTFADVSVETSGGVVQLSGFANNQAEINSAVEVAKKTSGVKSVRNDIRIKTPSTR